MNNDSATREQIEFADVIVNKLIAFNKIPLSHKNIWKDELVEILVEASCHPYPNLYDEIKKYCALALLLKNFLHKLICRIHCSNQISSPYQKVFYRLLHCFYMFGEYHLPSP
jgi:hypothetical protein